MLLWGCAMVGYHRPSLVSKAVNAVKGSLQKLSLRELGAMVWALATLGYNSQPVWEKLEAAAAKAPGTGTAEDAISLSMLAAGLALAQRRALLPAMVKRALETSNGSLPTAASSSLCQALGEAETPEPALWNELMRACVVHGKDRWKPAEATRAVQGLVHAPASKEREALSGVLAAALVDLEAALAPHEVAMAHHALCALGVPGAVPYAAVEGAFAAALRD